MANVIEVVLRANDQMTGNMNKAQGGIQGFTKSLGNMIAMVGGITVLTLGIKKLISLAGQQEEAEYRLAAAMKQKGVYTEQAIRHNLDYAASLQQRSRYGDEEIMVVQEMLMYFGIEGRMLDRLTASTLDLAAAKRMQLSAAADLVAKSVGSSTNALTRYGIQVEGAVGSTERMQMAVDNISKIFGGSAQAAANTYAGKVDQLKNEFFDLGETIGKVALPALKEMAKDTTDNINRIDAAIQVMQKQKAEKGFWSDALRALEIMWAEGVKFEATQNRINDAIDEGLSKALELNKAGTDFGQSMVFDPGGDFYKWLQYTKEGPPPGPGPSQTMLDLADAIEKVKQGWRDAAMQDLATFMAGGQRMGALEPRGADTGKKDRGLALKGFDQLEELPDLITPGLDAMDEMTAKWAEMGVTVETVSSGIGSTFGNATYSMLASGQNLWESLKSEATRWAAHTIAEIIRVKVAMAALNWLTGGISGAISGNIPISAPGGGPSLGMAGGPATVINNYHVSAIDDKSLRYAFRHGGLGREARKAGY